MFSYKKCAYAGCTHFALSNFDAGNNLIESDEYCYAHIKNKDEYLRKLYDYILSHDKIVGLNASGVTFTNIDFSNKGFYGCNFSSCLFAGINSKKIRVRMTTFEFTTFSDSNFIESNSHFTSYAGAKFSHVNLMGSVLIQDNFCGLSSFQSSFDDSDLYSSYFINAKLIDTSFRNCNIKETVFREITQRNVSFRQSNTNAAIFDKRGSALFTGLEELNVPRGVQKGPTL